MLSLALFYLAFPCVEEHKPLKPQVARYVRRAASAGLYIPCWVLNSTRINIAAKASEKGTDMGYFSDSLFSTQLILHSVRQKRAFRLPKKVAPDDQEGKSVATDSQGNDDDIAFSPKLVFAF